MIDIARLAGHILERLSEEERRLFREAASIGEEALTLAFAFHIPKYGPEIGVTFRRAVDRSQAAKQCVEFYTKQRQRHQEGRT
jgi:hypothetical protein